MSDEPAISSQPNLEQTPHEQPSSLVDAQGLTINDSFAPSHIPSNVSHRYRLHGEIGRGGMGAVYRATDLSFGREVAVKVLLNTNAPGSGSSRRFHDEARITGQLQHPGIPAAHDLGTLPDGRPFLAMKLIKGVTLDELFKEATNQGADRGRLVAVFEGVCQAVAYAHAHNVVHRDLKPSNIMVGAFGEVQVMDWGLAKVITDGPTAPTDDPKATAAATAVGSTRDSQELLTQAGSVLGTPAYMPPEQAIGAIHEVDSRSDVFGLGGILAAIITGLPPFVRDTAETTRILAARGEVHECFDRLDRCGADPGLIALAKRCLAPRRDDRPNDAGAVADEIAALRIAADERARFAEVEMATLAAASIERRKRRRVWQASAAVLTLAGFTALGAILAIQHKANRDMASVNATLASKNDALVRSNEKVEQRFDMARRAIAAFHTTLEEQPELGNEAFRPLRQKLLTSAAGFYRELELLLTNEPDAKSQSALADGFSQLAELTSQIGDQSEAIKTFQQALALRQQLATAADANTETKLAVSVTLRQIGRLLSSTGDQSGAMRAFTQALDNAIALERENPTDEVRSVLAGCHYSIGTILSKTSTPEAALDAYQQARDIQQALVDGSPSEGPFQSDLARSFDKIGIELQEHVGKPTEALAAFQAALDIRQRLAEQNPESIRFQSGLATSQYNMAVMLRRLDQPDRALPLYQDALKIYQHLADTHPAVTEYQSDVATCHQSIGWLLGQDHRWEEAHIENVKARDVLQALVDAHPTTTNFKSDLAQSHDNIGIQLCETGQLHAAMAAFEKAKDLRQMLLDAQPNVTPFQLQLAKSHFNIAELFERQGQLAQAQSEYTLAEQLFQKLVDAQPSVPGHRSELASTKNRLGRVLARLDQFEAAFDALNTGLSMRQTLLDSVDEDKKPETSYLLGFSYAYRGWANTRAGRVQEAAADLRIALQLWEDMTHSDANDFVERARVLALLVTLGADPASNVTESQAVAYADQAISDLAEAIRDGWSNQAEWESSDWDSLRARADFQLLQKAMQPRTDLETHSDSPPVPPKP